MVIIRYRKLFYLASLVLIIVSLVMVWNYRPPLSIEFSGGSLLELAYQDEVPSTGDVTAILSGEKFQDEAGLRGLTIQKTGDQTMLLRFGPVDEAMHQVILSALPKAEELRFESIGPVIGEELRQKTVWALMLAVIGMFLYVGVVFRRVRKKVPSWKMGLSAIITLAHDVIIMSGGYIVFANYYGFDMGILFITALLTVWGYSINDTIVIFDRVRENVLKEEKKNIEDTFAASIKQTMGRSITTSLAVFILLLSLALMGPTPLLPFVLPLLVGVAVGTYSSITIAVPLLSERIRS